MRWIALAVVGALAACAGERDAATPAADEAPASGDATFATICARCHGPDGRGGPPVTPGGPRPRDFTDAAWQATRTDAQLAAVIRDGKPPMPAFQALLSPAEIAAVVAKIRRFAGGGAR